MQGKIKDSIFVVEFNYPKNTKLRTTKCSVYLTDKKEITEKENPLKKEVRENATLTLVGNAMCHTQDNFCKDTGRKYALKRALETKDSQNKPILSKEEREVVWETYLNRTSS